ncbi:hypothetical protein H632_c4756p0, partial [Helicosporidium sp. ATCC 50920]
PGLSVSQEINVREMMKNVGKAVESIAHDGPAVQTPDERARAQDRAVVDHRLVLEKQQAHESDVRAPGEGDGSSPDPLQLEQAILEIHPKDAESKEAAAKREAEQRAKEEAQRRQSDEAERRQREKEESERRQREKEESERLRREKEESERLRREKEESERLRREKEESERLRREQEESERLRREQAARERAALQQADLDAEEAKRRQALETP